MFIFRFSIVNSLTCSNRLFHAPPVKLIISSAKDFRHALIKNEFRLGPMQNCKNNCIFYKILSKCHNIGNTYPDHTF